MAELNSMAESAGYSSPSWGRHDNALETITRAGLADDHMLVHDACLPWDLEWEL